MRYFFAIVKADGSNIDDKTSVDYPTESDAVVFGRSMANDLAAKGDQYIGACFRRRCFSAHLLRIGDSQGNQSRYHRKKAIFDPKTAF